MHYRHVFHAGNFADVFKHVLLIGLLRGLSRKATPWFYLDTHSGAGLYPLEGEAERTGEWTGGIGRLDPTATAPDWVAQYLGLVETAADRRRRIYPGSPWIAAQLARDQDRVVCCERVAEVADQLRSSVPRAQVHHRNGFEGLSLLPPAERRGLVLIDPPYEARDEFEQIAKFLDAAQKRWKNGIYAVWYPIKQQYAPERFVRRVTQASCIPWINCTLDTGAPSSGQMHACGLLVGNPPFAWSQQAPDTLAWLSRALRQGPKANYGFSSPSQT